jgi:hypothetical protein
LKAPQISGDFHIPDDRDHRMAVANSRSMRCLEYGAPEPSA